MKAKGAISAPALAPAGAVAAPQLAVGQTCTYNEINGFNRLQRATIVREIARFGGNIGDFVHPAVAARLRAKAEGR